MKKIIVFILLGLLILVILAFIKPSNQKTKNQIIRINGHKFTVDIADTETQRTRGLSGRSSIPQDYGMLFIFPNISRYQFWMKDMKFPLDFIWINGNKIVDLTENVPIPTDLLELKTISAKFPFDKVLEVNAGVVRSLNIGIGDVIIN